METFEIALVFTCPYIAQRNGGNRVLHTGLKLEEAKDKLLNLFNDKHDYPYSETLKEAELISESHMDNMILGDDIDTFPMFHYDSRIYKILKEEKEEDAE
jgi:hypothetical protein